MFRKGHEWEQGVGHGGRPGRALALGDLEHGMDQLSSAIIESEEG